MTRSILVLGAGMIGTCTALHLQQRGYEVCLIDRREPGRETSYGNAGIIQREAVQPYALPRDLKSLLRAALGLGADVHYQARALPQVAPKLLKYFKASAPANHAKASQAYSRLIEHALTEHQPLMDQAGAQDLVARQGFRFGFRSEQGLADAVREAQQITQAYGVRHQVLDARQLHAEEPALKPVMAGAVHWLDPWSVADPGELVSRYAAAFVRQGGVLLRGDAASLQAGASGWQVQSEQGLISAQQAVIALGPWSDLLVRKFGYRFPLFIKRGYHQHYAGGGQLKLALLDAERGYVLAPMRRGTRLTTGAQFAALDAPPDPVQLGQAQRLAQQLIDLGQPVDAQAWLGSRPCVADMLPVMGAAPAHPGLWFNFGHAHQGFTLGPVAGRLVAELIASEGRNAWIDHRPFSPSRFG